MERVDVDTFATGLIVKFTAHEHNIYVLSLYGVHLKIISSMIFTASKAVNT